MSIYLRFNQSLLTFAIIGPLKYLTLSILLLLYYLIMSTSFVKKINLAPQLYKTQKGVKPFPNQQYAISSGNPSLDVVCGGGLVLGSVVVVYEDSYSHYTDHLVKTYLGEGIVNEHKLLIVDPDTFRDRDYWLRFLPAVFKLKESSAVEKQEESKVS